MVASTWPVGFGAGVSGGLLQGSVESSRPSFETVTPSVADDERTMRQARVALFGKVACLVAVALYGLGAALSVLDRSFVWLRTPLHPSSLLHLAAIAALAATWWACSRRRRLKWTTLRWIDTGAVVFVCVVYALMGAFVPARYVPELAMILAVTNTLVARVVIVPTSAGRTSWIGALSAVPTVSSTWYVHFAAAGVATATVRALIAAGWLALAVVLVALAARLIYGLRKQVREARTFGQYTLEEPIGKGGMGEVYRARHAMLRRPTALKLLSPERSGELDLLRFEREVQLTSQLTHPNTVAVYDYGRTPDGIFYYAMEYLDGVDLEELVRADGPQPAARVVHILRQICGALDEAHGIGLIHRDVKPANVLLCLRAGQSDVAKVVDFGLVKSVLESGGSRATHANVVAGTPGYLPPEALLSPETVDRRADLYAVGAVGYFLLTGKSVFDGRNAIEVFDRTLHAAPPPPSERLGEPVPAPLEALLLSCLEKDPAARPATAQAIATSLESLHRSIGRWTVTDARAWWREHGEEIRSKRVQRSGERERPGTPAKRMTIDLRRR